MKKYVIFIFLLFILVACTKGSETQSSSSSTTSSNNGQTSSVVESSSQGESSSKEETSSQESTTKNETSSQESSESTSSSSSSSEEEVTVFKSLETVYQMIYELDLDSKGSATGKEIIIEATCYARIDTSLLLFTDGKRILKIHGDKEEKLWNYARVGNVYQVRGNIGVFKYQPQLDLVTHDNIVLQSSEGITEVETKKVTVDEIIALPTSNMSMFGYVLEIECYVNLDTRDSDKPKYVFTQTASGTIHTASGRYNGLYVQNYDKYDIIEKLDPYYVDEIKITAYCTMYDTFKDHSKDFWRVYAFSNLIV